MKDMLSKIYNSDYFVIGLFIVIVILAIVFLLLVFSGKKKKDREEVKVNKEENNNLEQNLETINSVNAASGVEAASQPESAGPSLIDPMQQAPVPEVKAEPVAPEMPTVAPAPVTIDPAVSVPETKAPAPVDMSAKEAPANEPSFNTSIFHGMPESIANSLNEQEPASVSEPSQPEEINAVAIGENSVVTPENDLTNNLFEPAPDLSQVSVDVPLNIENPTPDVAPSIPQEVPTPSVNDIMPTFNEPPKKEEVKAPVEAPIPEPKLGDYQKERIQMPNQFSSVYINKEEPKPKEPAPIEEPKKPPYDPTLFTSILNPNPATPEVKEEVKEEPAPVEKPIIPEPVAPAPEPPKVNIPIPEFAPDIKPDVKPEIKPEVKPVEQPEPVTPEPISFELPKFDTIPPLEPIGEAEEELEKTATDIKINPKNTFEMPSLAKTTPETPTPDADTETGLPNFNNETFNINK